MAVLAVTIVGLAIVFAAAIVVSFSDQYGLALYLGWGATMAPLLPLTVDVYALTTTIIWLAGGRDLSEAQRHARAHATVALSLSVANNIAFRAIEAGAWNPGAYRWVLVVIVAAIPPATVGALAHLAVMLARGDGKPERPDDLVPFVVPRALLPTSADGLRNAVPTLTEWQERALDEFRDELAAGRPPSVRDVKQRLRMSSERASELAAFLRSWPRS